MNQLILYQSLVFIALIWTTSCKWADFCSLVCGTSCDGDLKTDCKSCHTDGAWQSSGSTCIIRTSSDWALHDTTSDLGGGLDVAGATYQDTCYDFQVYGYIFANQMIRVSTPGITVPYYSMRMYVGILALNSICWGCNPGYYWTNTSSFSILFNDPQGTQTVNPLVYTLMNNVSKTSGKCEESSRDKSSWIRASRLYSYSLTNTLLRWTISCNQTLNQKKWGIREFMVIYRACDTKCTACFGAGPTKCTACSASPTLYWLSGSTCSDTCLAGYGQSTSNTCIPCDKRCKECYMIADNCSSCTTSGINASFLITYNVSYPTCNQTCEIGYFGNKATRTCEPCATGCEICVNLATYCTKCLTGYLWTGWTCNNPCPSGFFQDPNGTNCTRCYPFCQTCVGAYNICTVCVLNGSFQAYLYNTTSTDGVCMRLCPIGTYRENYGGLGPNLCIACNNTCASCSGNATNCLTCAPAYYMINSTCQNTCPNGTIATNLSGTGQCIDCNIICVDLSINMYFPDILNQKLYIDMVFTQNLNYSSFDIQAFQNITITSQHIKYTADMFTWTYVNLSTASYRIIIEPKSYIFLYNATFTVTTKAEPVPAETSLSGIPFKSSVYLKTAAQTWFLIKGPPFNSLETGIMTSFSKLSTKTNYVLTLPYVQQIKKSGIFNLLFSGAQATSLSVLSNQIQSQNLYEGVRVWAIFVFFDAPPYESISDKTKRFVSPTIQDQIRYAQQVPQSAIHSHRQLFSTTSMYWRFQRTGYTSFFIYDVYIPIFLIVLCWIGLIVAYFSKNTRWYSAYAPNLYSAVHKIHQISILYVTMASIVEFVYFQPTSLQRIISAITCVAFNVYFLGYELYIYYDLINYPKAQIGSSLYDYYVVRYGFFLKTIRFVEYDITEGWKPNHWLRPYNYHILSFYKKCLMVIALPLFYPTPYAQMSVLVIIQLLQMFRFWATWPFLSKGRNYFRLSLEFSLFCFFLINLIQIPILQAIMQGDSNTIQSSTSIFYNLGWAGFAFCFYFNIGFICENIYSLFVGLKESNRVQMERARRKYYFQKISSYEKDNQASSKELVYEWMKLGNLHNKNYGELPQINVRIELFQFRKTGNKFHLLIKKITSLFMKQNAKLRKHNNTTAGSKIEKSITIGESDNQRLYHILNEVYKKYEDPHVETIRLKTFLNIWQKDYRAGQSINFDRNLMFQKIELISYENQSRQLQLKTLLDDFPIDASILDHSI